MHITKKLLTGAVAVYLLSGASAYANEFNLDVNLGGPAVVAAPAYVVAPSPAFVAAPWVEGYDPHHRRHDMRYWHDHRDPHWHDHH